MKPEEKIGSWTLLEECPPNWWKCRCDCGTEKLVLTKNLKERRTFSCGCLRIAAHRRVMNDTFQGASHGLR